MSRNPHKVALVHDFLLTFGGAERVLKVLADMYPGAPIYTLLSDKKVIQKYFPGREIRPSFLQRFPRFLRRHYQWLLPFYPVAVETFDLREFDLVLSSSGAWSKGIITRLDTRHIAYLHSPMRFVWDSFHRNEWLQGKRQLFRRLLLTYIRLWDKEAAARPDILLVNSQYTLERLTKFYRLPATVLYPPLTSFPERPLSAKGDFFLLVARLVPSKEIALVIEAFQKLELPLHIVGEGREREKWEKRVGSHITFLGRISDAELVSEYQEARALIQPSVEDFGLVSAEALSRGTPIIAQGEGAAREIIEPGVTGEIFEGWTPESLADGVRRFVAEGKVYSQVRMREIAERFSRARFEAGIREATEKANHLSL